MNSKWEEKLLLLCVIKEGFKVFSAFLGKNQEKCVCVCVKLDTGGDALPLLLQ